MDGWCKGKLPCLECEIEDGLAGKAESHIAVYKSLVLTGTGKAWN